MNFQNIDNERAKKKIGVKSIDNNLNQIKEWCKTISNKKKRILFVGLTNPSFFKFYEELRKSIEYEFIWLRSKKDYTETFTHGFVIKIPSEISYLNYHLLTEEVILSDTEQEELCSLDAYAWAYDNIMKTHPQDDENCVRKALLLTGEYFRQIIEIMSPAAVMFWNPYVGFNRIGAEIAYKANIPVIYAESGVIPGTLGLSTWGDLGESRPSVDYLWFQKLKVEQSEIDKARKVIEYIKESGFNRNIQPKRTMLPIFDIDRPIVFLAGQNDSECGLVPYDEKAKVFSPMFSSSEDMVEYVAEIAHKNRWNLLYKPHPIVMRRNLEIKSLPSNVILVKEGDINTLIDMCDCCLTILSTTAYVSLTRGKPVVMLGKIQLNGQGCTYEAYDRLIIEEKILCKSYC